MAHWKNLVKDNLDATGLLKRRGHYRSSVSRAYYTLYAAISWRLDTAGFEFRTDRQGPEHAKLVSLIRSNLEGLSDKQRREMCRIVRLLYDTRCAADYRPGTTIDRVSAEEVQMNLRTALRVLEFDPR